MRLHMIVPLKNVWVIIYYIKHASSLLIEIHDFHIEYPSRKLHKHTDRSDRFTENSEQKRIHTISSWRKYLKPFIFIDTVTGESLFRTCQDVLVLRFNIVQRVKDSFYYIEDATRFKTDFKIKANRAYSPNPKCIYKQVKLKS